MNKLNYSEGDIFSVPLPSGELAIGLVARIAKEGKVLLGYFWGPSQSTIPAQQNLPLLQAQDALLVMRFGDLRLINKNWPIIARIPQWDRSLWPMPKFVRRNPISKRAWLVNYSDDDPNQIIYEESCDYDIDGYSKDALAGAEAIEIVLTHLLKPDSAPTDT